MIYLKFTKRNIKRTPYQALVASMVMFVTFMVISLFIVIAVGSEKVLQYYESKPQAIAFFKDGTEYNDIEAIKKALLATGKVTKLTFISKEEALEIYRQANKDNPALLELVSANILPASLEISTENPEDLAPIADVLRQEPVVEQVIYPKDVVESLSTATKTVRWIGTFAVSFLAIFSTLVILMVTGFKIRLKRNEIEIMRLLGASNWFIRAPFLLEGIVYGVIGAGLAWIMTYLVLWYFSPVLERLLTEINILPVSLLFMLELLIFELLVAVIIGIIGSYGAVRRYLRF